LLVRAEVLAEFGPALGRPWVDTLKASAFPNMKEMRFEVQGGVWRVAFAFDPARRAVLLVAANKIGLRGRAEQRFYQVLIATADARYSAHLARLGSARRKR
jgi:hypothetical protein